MDATEFLKRSPTTPAQRAELWDAFESSKDEDELASKLAALKVPDSVKAGLWDLKASSPRVMLDLPRREDRPTEPPAGPTGDGGYKHPLASFGAGFMKGAANTAVGLGKIVRGGASALTGGMVDPEAQAFEAARAAVKPRPDAERAGFTAEQMAEFFAIPQSAGAKAMVLGSKALATVPGALRAAKIGDAAALGLVTGGLVRSQGGTEGEQKAAAVLSTVPAGAAVTKAGSWIGSKAAPLVRSAIKPTVAAMRRVTGVGGLDDKAEKLVRFIIDNRLTTPEKAQKMLLDSERELQRLLKTKNAPTDAPQRALRYLDALERQAQKAGLGDDAALVRKAAEDVFDSDLGVAVPGNLRGLRSDVTPSEALDIARLRSKLRNRKQWGEQKSTSVEASKAIERAARDAVKAAVPEAKPILAKEGMAIQARDILDRADFRAANRDAVSLPAHVIAAGEVAAGNLPKLAFAANWLRNNQMKAGIWADALGKAIANQDVATVAEIMKRLGVASIPATP